MKSSTPATGSLNTVYFLHSNNNNDNNNNNNNNAWFQLAQDWQLISTENAKRIIFYCKMSSKMPNF